jgi:DNA-binding HxlR family transcriptional regulator
MHDQSNGPSLANDPGIAERAIVLQVLRDDRPPCWTQDALRVELYDIDPRALRKALRRLERHGVVQRAGREAWASRCALRLDALGMIAI